MHLCFIFLERENKQATGVCSSNKGEESHGPGKFTTESAPSPTERRSRKRKFIGQEKNGKFRQKNGNYCLMYWLFCMCI